MTPTTLHCPNCNYLLPSTVAVCPKCGFAFGVHAPYFAPPLPPIKKQSVWKILGLVLLALAFWPITCVWLIVKLWQHPVLTAQVKTTITATAVVLFVMMVISTYTQSAQDKIAAQKAGPKAALYAAAPRPKPTPQVKHSMPDIVRRPAVVPLAPKDTIPISYKIALIDTGNSALGRDDPIIAKYQAQIDGIKQSGEGCTDSEIANTAYVVSQSELKKGVDENSLSVLEAVNQSCPTGIKIGRHLDEVFAAYAALRINGIDRQSAIIQINGMFHTLARH